MKFYIFVFVLVAFCFFVPSQSFGQSQKIRKAYEEFNAGHYKSASDMLKRAYSSAKGKEEQAEVQFKIGECHRMLSEPALAEQWYKKAMNKGFPDPVVHLHMGEVKKMMRKYEEAIEEFKNFKEKSSGDRRGDDGISACNFAI